jgi:hypothetical protein
LLVAEVAEIAITAAQALASQANLFPPQEATAGAAEVWTLLHVGGGNVGLGRLLGGTTLVAVDERLRNTWSRASTSAAIREREGYIPSVSSLIEPKDGRWRLLDREPSRASQEEGDESRETMGISPVGAVVKRGMAGLAGAGAGAGVTEVILEASERDGPL